MNTSLERRSYDIQINEGVLNVSLNELRQNKNVMNDGEKAYWYEI